ncbi:MAG: glutamate--tRNA ligase family protein [Puniceicoccaceae bacterium]
MSPPPYRGRLAPTPSGYLHAGHARTFAAAWKRARQRNGTLVYRLEDIDRRRSRPEYARAAEEDLRWLGLDWDEGGGRGGPVGPYVQSERIAIHRRIWHGLIAAGRIYPAPFSRRDILRLDPAREADGGIRFPEALRPASAAADPETADPSVNWRFRVPEGRAVRFTDGLLGETVFAAGRDFGDFLVWRREGGPSYELAVVADDIAMGVTEVVRGADLLLSTARQLLLYEALAAAPPVFRHEPLVRDRTGARLSKTAGSVAIRHLRARGWTPSEVLRWEDRPDDPAPRRDSSR